MSLLPNQKSMSAFNLFLLSFVLLLSLTKSQYQPQSTLPIRQPSATTTAPQSFAHNVSTSTNAPYACTPTTHSVVRSFVPTVSIWTPALLVAFWLNLPLSAIAWFVWGPFIPKTLYVQTGSIWSLLPTPALPAIFPTVSIALPIWIARSVSPDITCSIQAKLAPIRGIRSFK